ncbi:ParA family protein [Heyndrickxia sporothermodurans]|uniref:ParA family protein n=1 Tax=Heyndrickxia sporothermodurans TaxID=46224 RepID=UPI0013FD1624|nr:AAA family ATPase [Heyndrickxia sporothermodurans]
MGNPIVLTCANHKGGSGKSSLAGSLISALAEQGFRVLGVDGDMQRNLSTTYGLREFGKEKNLYRAIEDLDEKDDFNGADYIVSTEYENVDFIVSHEDMALLETSLMLKMAERERYVSKLIDSINETQDYDFIVFDTNPTLGVLNFNIFVASNHIIIPVECSAYGVDGLGAILKFYKNTRRVNKDLKIGGIVMHKVDIRKSIAKDAIEVVRDMFGDIIFNTMISIDTSVEKSQWDEIPLLYHTPDSRAAKQYRQLTKEVLAVVGKQSVVQK